MSLRQVLTIYNAERQLNEDDAALLNTLRRLKDADRELLVQELSDKPQKKPGKRTTGKGASKSARASSLAEKVGGTLASIAKTAGGSDENTPGIVDAIGGGDSDARCQFTRADNKLCRLLPDHNVHHLATANEFHEFVAGKSDAQSAVG